MLSPQPTRICRTAQELVVFPELVEEGARLTAGDPAARYPLGLKCTRCGGLFLWLANALRTSDAPTDRFEELTQEWEPLRWNFVAGIVEAVHCPGCRFVDEHALLEDPRPAFAACLYRLAALDTHEARHLAARLAAPPREPVTARTRSPLEQHLDHAQRLAGPRQDATTLTRYALSCQELKQSVRALAAARSALGIEPAALEPLLMMAEIALRQRAWPEALTLLRRAADNIASGKGVRLIRSADRTATLLAQSLQEASDRAHTLWTPQDERRLDVIRGMTGAPSWMS